MEGVNLIVVSPLKALPLSNRKILLTRKFFGGIGLYCELWRGAIIHACEPSPEAGDNLDNMEVALDAAPFRTIYAEFSDGLFARLLTPNSLVLASVGERFNSLSRLCPKAGIPCIYIEYSLRTRLQIEYRRTIMRGCWRSRREIRQERAQVQAISVAPAVQWSAMARPRSSHISRSPPSASLSSTPGLKRPC
jgi:hypothetical protein